MSSVEETNLKSLATHPSVHIGIHTNQRTHNVRTRHHLEIFARKILDRYCDVIVYKNIWVRASTSTRRHRLQKFPLWRASTEISGDTECIRRTRVEASCICIKTFADAKSPDSCGRGLSSNPWYHLPGR